MPKMCKSTNRRNREVSKIELISNSLELWKRFATVKKQ